MRIPRLLLLLPALAALGCATTEAEKREDPIADFIEVAELPTVERVRTEGDYTFMRVNEYYVILRTRGDHYLGQLKNRCPGLSRRGTIDEGGNLLLRSNVDIRHNPKIFYAGQDTILGCLVENLYIMDEQLVSELRSMPPPTGPGQP